MVCEGSRRSIRCQQGPDTMSFICSADGLDGDDGELDASARRADDRSRFQQHQPAGRRPHHLGICAWAWLRQFFLAEAFEMIARSRTTGCQGPFVFAPIAELFGRKAAYTTSTIPFALINAACVIAPNLPSLIVLRFFAGVFGSSGPGLGVATV